MSQQAAPDRFMWMESPQQALDIIAHIIHMKADIAGKIMAQDDWLKAAHALGFVEVDVEEVIE